VVVEDGNGMSLVAVLVSVGNADASDDSSTAVVETDCTSGVEEAISVDVIPSFKVVT
jgi:hypothetical protein